MKVLIAGHSAGTHLSVMCEGVKMADPSISFSVLNLMEVWDKVDLSEYSKYFDARYSDNKISLRNGTPADYLKIFTKGLVGLIKGRGVQESLGKKAIAQYFKDKYLNELFRQHDVINFHYLDEHTYKYLKNIQPNNKVVCSFWGSDLLVDSTEENRAAVDELVNRADTITVHTAFHENVLLNKFGEHLKPKVKKVLFGLSYRHIGKLQEITRNNKEDLGLSHFIQEEYGVDVNKYKHIIRVGYNGNKEQNHIPVINSLKHVTNSESVLLLVPISYGLPSNDYKNDIEHALKSSGFKYVIVDEYLSEQYAFELGRLCDIAIMVRDTDALNNALIEELMAGSFVIAGSWLPYQILSDQGVFFEQVDDFDVASKVQAYINSEDNYRDRLENNSQVLYEFISNKRNGKYWAVIFKSIAS